MAPFDVTPEEAEIGGGASSTLTVTFSPDHPSDAFWQLVEVAVPNQEGRCLLAAAVECTGSRGAGEARLAKVAYEQMVSIAAICETRLVCGMEV